MTARGRRYCETCSNELTTQPEKLVSANATQHPLSTAKQGAKRCNDLKAGHEMLQENSFCAGSRRMITNILDNWDTPKKEVLQLSQTSGPSISIAPFCAFCGTKFKFKFKLVPHKGKKKTNECNYASGGVVVDFEESPASKAKNLSCQMDQRTRPRTKFRSERHTARSGKLQRRKSTKSTACVERLETPLCICVWCS